jgi:hypothetical protein
VNLALARPRRWERLWDGVAVVTTGRFAQNQWMSLHVVGHQSEKDLNCRNEM